MKKIKSIILAVALTLFVIPLALIFTGCKTSDGIVVRKDAMKTTYYIGEEVEIVNGVMDVTKDGKTIQVVITEDMISNFSTSKTGNRDMIITYDGYTATINYTVLAPVTLNTNISYSSTYDNAHFGWIRFNEDMTLAYEYGNGGSEEPAISQYTSYGNRITLEKTIVNGKYVLNGGYSRQNAGQTISMSCKIIVNDENSFDIYEWETGSIQPRNEGATFYAGVAPIEIGASSVYVSGGNGSFVWMTFTEANHVMYYVLTDTDTVPASSAYINCVNLTKSVVDGKVVYSGYYEETNNNIEITNVTSTGFEVITWEKGTRKVDGYTSYFSDYTTYHKSK